MLSRYLLLRHYYHGVTVCYSVTMCCRNIHLYVVYTRLFTSQRWQISHYRCPAQPSHAKPNRFKPIRIDSKASSQNLYVTRLFLHAVRKTNEKKSESSVYLSCFSWTQKFNAALMIFSKLMLCTSLYIYLTQNACVCAWDTMAYSQDFVCF